MRYRRRKALTSLRSKQLRDVKLLQEGMVTGRQGVPALQC